VVVVELAAVAAGVAATAVEEELVVVAAIAVAAAARSLAGMEGFAMPWLVVWVGRWALVVAAAAEADRGCTFVVMRIEGAARCNFVFVE
jgi:hypothetical protein